MMTRVLWVVISTWTGLVGFGCGTQVKDAPVERMAEARPAWINKPSGQCLPGFRCLVVQGEAPDLSDARSSARGKGVSELVSELAVRIRSRLSVNESQRFSNGNLSEESQVSQTLESRVRGQLVGVRTLSEYWERRFTYSSSGSALSYQAWLTVGVPISTLDSLRDDAKQRTATFEAGALKLAQTLENSSTDSAWRPEEAMHHLQSAQRLLNQETHLMIDSPTGQSTLSQIRTLLNSGLKMSLIRQGREPGGEVKLATQLTLFGSTLPGAAYEITGLSNGELASSRGQLSQNGHLLLSLSAVEQLKPITFSVNLLSPSPVSIAVSVPPLLPVVPVSIEINLDRRVDAVTLRKTIRRRVLSAHPGLVPCERGDNTCFRLKVDFRLLNATVKMARGVYQSRGHLRVHLSSRVLTHVHPVERTLQGAGSTPRQSQHNLQVRLADELERLIPGILKTL